MSTYTVTYMPGTDTLDVILNGAEPNTDIEMLRTAGGLEVQTADERSTLVRLTIPTFSRQVDFFELFEMFGHEFVLMLSDIQAELLETHTQVSASRSPMRSRDLRQNLISA